MEGNTDFGGVQTQNSVDIRQDILSIAVKALPTWELVLNCLCRNDLVIQQK